MVTSQIRLQDRQLGSDRDIGLSVIERRASFKVREEHLDAALEAIRDFIAGIAAHEPGTTIYHSYQDVDDPTSFFHLMRFTDAEAREQHVSSDHVKVFVDRLYPLCEDKPSFADVRTVAAR